MTYEEIVAYTKTKLADVDLSDNKGHLAVQVNITGEGEGAFYIELNDSTAVVEPYEYFDRDAMLTASADVFMAIVEGKKDAVGAYLSGSLKVEGSLDKASEFGNLLKKSKKKAAKKTTKKPAVKKTTAKKADAKKADAKEVKPTAAVKKAAVATAKKVTVKKAATKNAETK